MDRTKTQQLGHGAAALTGKALEGVFAATGRIRPTRKPLHPRGRLHSATIEGVGLRDGIGVPWVDDPGTSTGVVRVSRAIGIPTALPDIYGLSLRVPLVDGEHADLLFATTGLGRLTRFVLFPAQHPGQRAYSTLLPYRSPAGAVVLAAVPVGADGLVFDLACARVGGAWESFARMTLTETSSGDSPSFDPVLNQLPGLGYYDWAAAMREGAYRAARRSRSSDAAAGRRDEGNHD
ncbi:hypothetical protein [Aeromicrobium sp. NPDC092404]|uniref:hypothetical protein n=1 Tax=Aeromicrobium sp. NPDC092404 TaxID=3154976 RepID=UPI00342E32C9